MSREELEKEVAALAEKCKNNGFNSAGGILYVLAFNVSVNNEVEMASYLLPYAKSQQEILTNAKAQQN